MNEAWITQEAAVASGRRNVGVPLAEASLDPESYQAGYRDALRRALEDIEGRRGLALRGGPDGR